MDFTSKGPVGICRAASPLNDKLAEMLAAFLPSAAVANDQTLQTHLFSHQFDRGYIPIDPGQHSD